MSELVARLLSAGTDPALVAEVAREFGRLEGMVEAARAPDRAAENRRAYDRERKRLAKVSGGIPVESAEIAETPAPLVSPLPLSPDPLPQPPYNPPTPANPVRAKSSGFGPPEAVSAEAWDGFCKQRKKRMTQIAFDGIVERLAEHTNDLWPPDRLVRRAIECGHETIWPAPRDQANGTHQPNHAASAGRPQRASPALALLREAEFQERAECDQAFGGGTWPPLQALGAS